MRYRHGNPGIESRWEDLHGSGCIFCEARGGSCTLEDCQHPGAAQPDFLKVTWGI